MMFWRRPDAGDNNGVCRIVNVVFIAGLLLCRAVPVSAQQPSAGAPAATAGDSLGIRTAAVDYIEGWYSADAERMERALHPELAKRTTDTDMTTGRSTLRQVGAMTLVQQTRSGGGSYIRAAARRSDVQILDIFAGAASVRVTAATWIDYMHLTKFNGRWVIVNVLWEKWPSFSGGMGAPR